MRSNVLMLLVGAVALAACNQTSGGEGGGGATTTATSSSKATGTGTSSSSGDQCGSLLASFEAAVAAAQACDPMAPQDQCEKIIEDTCGCFTIVLSSQSQSKWADAEAAFDAWKAAGCKESACPDCPIVNGAPCIAAPSGGGICKPTP